MQKNLIGAFMFFSIYPTASFAYSPSSDHYSELKSKYPYGLLSDDHGVLTLNDLALNACHIKPEAFVPGALNPYEYWLCFESKSVLAICEDQNFSNEDGHVGRVTVDARDSQIAYHFIESRPWPIRDCKSFVKTLKNLMRGTSHACVSASYIDKEEKNERAQMERVGIFHRLKTKRGCEGTECILTEKAKKEYCPSLKKGAQDQIGNNNFYSLHLAMRLRLSVNTRRASTCPKRSSRA